MSYIYDALKPHLCTDVIGIIEDLVRWEGNANNGKKTFKFTFLRRQCKVTYNKSYQGDKLDLIGTYGYITSEFKYSIDRILKKWSMKWKDYVVKMYVIKVHENCYVLHCKAFSDSDIYIANNLQTLYDKYMTESEQEDFFMLEPLKN